MTCAHCRKKFAEEAARCPHCGVASREASGVFQTSVVLISSGGNDLIYRTVEEVPAGLRNKLLRSTNGANSATILIADRRGRKEVAKAMRTAPGSGRRLIRSAVGIGAASAARWLTPSRKRAVLAVLTLLVLTIVALVFSVRPLSGGH
jgi:hypothetical protein